MDSMLITINNNDVKACLINMTNRRSSPVKCRNSSIAFILISVLFFHNIVSVCSIEILNSLLGTNSNEQSKQSAKKENSGNSLTFEGSKVHIENLNLQSSNLNGKYSKYVIKQFLSFSPLFLLFASNKTIFCLLNI